MTIYSVRPGMSYVNVCLTIGTSGAVGSDGYGNTLSCDDVVRVSGEEAHATAQHQAKGLVKPGDWSVIAPVTLDGTGKYTVRFDDRYLGCTSFRASTEHATSKVFYQVKLISFTASSSTNRYCSSAVVQVVGKDNIAVNLASGSKLWLEFQLKTSEQG